LNPPKRQARWWLPVAVVASFAAAIAWTAAEFASGTGYWGWPVPWWLLALIWAFGGGLLFLSYGHRRLALLVVPLSLAFALLGGFATLLAWLLIYGTGD
jgi:peptidoglycan/LPS O-acetylase OafA/YrhL